MDFFDLLTLIGGLCLFLFGMDQLGSALERRAGEGLKALLARLTGGRAAGFFTGLAVTAVIQSSSAATVMVVGFVNSGLMTLRQAINVIMGANVGTTVTAWIFSLAGIESGSFFVQLLKPASFTPVLALIGVVCLMTERAGRRRDTGMILLSFAVLMQGMDTMSAAVSGLREVPGFRQLLLLFTHPAAGVLAGAVLTAVIQSSSASVGILQALASTGQVTYGAAIPIIMGQNIGTCVSAMLAAVGAGHNARRAALVHLSFNLIGTAVLLAVFQAVRVLASPPWLTAGIDRMGIAAVHSVFNLACTALLLPAAGLLEKLACRLIAEPRDREAAQLLDERLMASPPLAVQRCRTVAEEMAARAACALREALAELWDHDGARAQRVQAAQKDARRDEELLGGYLVRLSALPLSERDNRTSAELLHVIGELECISRHAAQLSAAASELREKALSFTPAARAELRLLAEAAEEAMAMALRAFTAGDMAAAVRAELLEQVAGRLKAQLRTRHIRRVRQGECAPEAGFIWADLLTGLGRVADHCAGVAGCVLELRSGPGSCRGPVPAAVRAEYEKKYQLE